MLWEVIKRRLTWDAKVKVRVRVKAARKGNDEKRKYSRINDKGSGDTK
jgi:hypothetical protein